MLSYAAWWLVVNYSTDVEEMGYFASIIVITTFGRLCCNTFWRKPFGDYIIKRCFALITASSKLLSDHHKSLKSG